MAPELFAPEPSYTKAADVWSLGVAIVRGQKRDWPEWPRSRVRAGLAWCKALIKYANQHKKIVVNDRRQTKETMAIAKLPGLKKDPAERSTAKKCLPEGWNGILYNPFKYIEDVDDYGAWASAQNDRTSLSFGWILSAEWDMNEACGAYSHDATQAGQEEDENADDEAPNFQEGEKDFDDI